MRDRLKFVALLILLRCAPAPEHTQVDIYESNLFRDVQLGTIFPDSKTFPDCTPHTSWSDVINAYEREKNADGFNLKQFVETNFTLPNRPQGVGDIHSTLSLENHLFELWDVLQRKPDQHDVKSSLIPLPNPYIVPGGRFSEIYYWDSYFSMLGLIAQDREDIVTSMVDNFAFLIDSVGHIPNGNRRYYLSRSQPPFFALMVRLLNQSDSTALIRYVSQLEKEYKFWMKDVDQLQNPGDTFGHVVKMPGGEILNRYWDMDSIPRPEAFKEDDATARESGRPYGEVCRHLRSAAESGMDFSSRWFADGKSLTTIRTCDLIPVDLNCLLYELEKTLEQAHRKIGNQEKQREYSGLATQRQKAIETYFWNDATGFYCDYDFIESQVHNAKTLAGMFPLFTNVADGSHASRASQVIEGEFLKPGGAVTTLLNTGEQWDAPNGWAPLQWVTYMGLKNYNQHALASQLRSRWLSLNERVYSRTGRMMEKYNVVDTTLTAGGGEYPNQDGFGWTNGVYLAMLKDSL